VHQACHRHAPGHWTICIDTPVGSTVKVAHPRAPDPRAVRREAAAVGIRRLAEAVIPVSLILRKSGDRRRPIRATGRPPAAAVTRAGEAGEAWASRSVPGLRTRDAAWSRPGGASHAPASSAGPLPGTVERPSTRRTRTMNPETFESELRRDGFAEIDTRSMPPGQVNPLHTHPFAVKAMVLDGEITLTVDGVARVYRNGDVFTMAPGCEHAEQVGRAGVSYLVGRRH